MRTDFEVKMKGIQTLIQTMGEVDAERFIALMAKEPFDYTKYQRTMLDNLSLEHIHAMAKAHRQKLEQET